MTADFWIDVAAPAAGVWLCAFVICAVVFVVLLARQEIRDRRPPRVGPAPGVLVELDLSRARRRQVTRRRGTRA